MIKLILQVNILFQSTYLLHSYAGKRWYDFLITIQKVEVFKWARGQDKREN